MTRLFLPDLRPKLQTAAVVRSTEDDIATALLSPLNPYLYARLEKYSLGRIKVQKAGHKQVLSYHFDDVYKRRSLWPEIRGEYYRVDCPKCGDSYQRLFINHCWGVVDRQTGDDRLWMAICFNENCFTTRQEMYYLFNRIDCDQSRLSTAEIKEGVVRDVSGDTMGWPGMTCPVNQLPTNHPAIQYLMSRGFNPNRLSQFYGVRYCQASEDFRALNRLIVPMLWEDKMRGWQSRYPGEKNWKDKQHSRESKYYTAEGFHKADYLYNLDTARKYETGVIVEGVTDVWRVGPQGMALLGKDVSDRQRALAMEHFRHNVLVLLLDADAWESEKTQSQIRWFNDHTLSGRFVAIQLPNGQDPGSMDRNILRDFIEAEAAKKGVEVTWKHRSEHSPAGDKVWLPS